MDEPLTLLWACLVVLATALALALGIRARVGSRRRMPDSADSEVLLPLSDRVGEAVLDSIPLGVVVGDSSGVPVFRNSAADALVDSWEDGVVGRLVAERLVDAAGGQGSSGQVRMPGSPPRLIEVTAVALAAPGASAVVIFDDITERHRQEGVRRDFVANVSHELKTPIGALCLLAETLVDEHEPEVVARLTSHIGTESLRAAAIVESLLDLSRIEEAPVEAIEPVDLADVAHEVVERMRATAGRRGVSVDVDATDAIGIFGSRGQLLSMVRNLVENAVKYSNDGDAVTIRLAGDETNALIEVVDQGMGIPAADHERVFERFYRVDRARARETGGSGLGLSIVRHVAQSHGGRVDLASTEGQGTTVTVRLPVRPGTGAPGTGAP
ncbi:MAG: two-component sensor histidine kinase [Actinobacteria bacterium]|nr:two-component sensor histidine kinase [Actinomycetota bacterium]